MLIGCAAVALLAGRPWIVIARPLSSQPRATCETFSSSSFQQPQLR
jgi:hypothetical protein